MNEIATLYHGMATKTLENLYAAEKAEARMQAEQVALGLEYNKQNMEAADRSLRAR